MNYQPLQSGGGFLSSIPPIVKNLIIINVLVFIASQISYELTYGYLALYFPGSPLFQPFQLITHMFMHGDFYHLFFNMYALWLFGSALENAWGSKRFIIFYLVSGVGAALFFSLAQWIQLMYFESHMTGDGLVYMKSLFEGQGFTDTLIGLHAHEKTYVFTGAANDWFGIMSTPMVGASGAIFAVLLGFGMMFPNVVLQLLFPPIALRAKYFVMIYGALELVLGITQPGASIAHLAHVGGMLFGYILIKVWIKKQRR